MDKEYQVVYTYEGRGYKDDLPWLYDTSTDLEDARQAHEHAVEWLKNTKDPVVWIEAREVGPWSKVDIS